jgi:hypothetical protein
MFRVPGGQTLFSWQKSPLAGQCMYQRKGQRLGAIREDLAGYGEPIPENMLEWDIERLDVSF